MSPRYLPKITKLFFALPLLLASMVVSAQQPSLDFEFFRSQVQPIFLAKRDGNVRCVQCHYRSSGFRIQALEEGATFWTEEQSRLNFESASQFVDVGGPLLNSRFLTHPLSRDAGGDPFHGGGKHFKTLDDPEFQIMVAWTRGATRRSSEKLAVRIVQTNAAGDISHVIDPETNKVVGIIEDIEIPHGIIGAPDGTEFYISNESLHTLDVVDSQTFRVIRRVHLSGRPNNISIGPDGKRVYVAIMQMPGSVDIIDTESYTLAKTLSVHGAIHNVYVTPDGKYAIAGSIQTRTINVIDTATEEVAWTLEMDAGIRPMAFDTHADGSTRNIYVQLSGFHGFAVVDFNKREVVARIEHPAVPGVEAHFDGLQGAPAHGLGVSPDNKTVWSTSKMYGYAYVHSTTDGWPEIGRVFVGQHPEWITFTPDNKYAYIAAAGDNMVYVVDVETIKVVARIPVGQVPKRNGTILVALPDS